MSHTVSVPKFEDKVRVSFSGRTIASQAIDAVSITATRTLFSKQAIDAVSILLTEAVHLSQTLLKVLRSNVVLLLTLPALKVGKSTF